MKIAIPLTSGTLSSHFGHCEQFAVIDADPKTKKILSREDVTPPPHEPGLYPKWLAGSIMIHPHRSPGVPQRHEPRRDGDHLGALRDKRLEYSRSSSYRLGARAFFDLEDKVPNVNPDRSPWVVRTEYWRFDKVSVGARNFPSLFF
jgi:hypothetical protein